MNAPLNAKRPSTTLSTSPTTAPEPSPTSSTSSTAGSFSLRWIGAYLVAARKDQGLAQWELAERLGLHQPNIARWESELYRHTSLERIVAVAEALEVSLQLEVKPPSQDAERREFTSHLRL